MRTFLSAVVLLASGLVLLPVETVVDDEVDFFISKAAVTMPQEKPSFWQEFSFYSSPSSSKSSSPIRYLTS